MATKYLISTTMGDSILDPISKLYVQLSPSSYVRKNVVDINVGDMVLFEKPQAKTDLEDVDPHLIKSPRYALSKEMLHEQNSRGEFIPKLRTLLLKGLAERGVIGNQDIHAKTLYETNDFTKEDYERMEEWLVETLERYGKDRSTQAIGNWLRGETLAPSDWEIFRILEKEVSPQFADFRPYEEDPKSLYFNYELYVNIRRGIMRYLNECRGTTEVSEPRRQEKPHISLSPEYAIVFQHFMNDRNDTQATTRVTGIEKILKRPHLDHIIKTNKFLGEGVLKKEIENLKFLLRDYKDLMDYSYILLSYLNSFLEDFDFNIPKEIDERQMLLMSDRKTKAAISSWILPIIIRPFCEEPDDFTLYIESKATDRLKILSEATKKAFLGRDMDSFFRYSNGTAMSLLESYYRVHKSIPSRIYQYIAKAAKFYVKMLDDAEDQQIPRTVEPEITSVGGQIALFGVKNPSKLKKEAETIRLREEREMIKNRYGLHFDLIGKHNRTDYFFSDKLEGALTLDIDPITGGHLQQNVTGREYIENIRSKEVIRELRDKKVAQDIVLITRDRAQKALKEFNLGRIIDRRWQDFVWEDV